MVEKKLPKVATGIIIYNEKNEIFLGRSHKWDNKWIIPGGKIDWGESGIDCAKREVKEETNLDIIDIELIDVVECIFPENFFKEIHFIFFDYCAKAVSDNIILNDEFQEHIWIDPRKALDLDINTDVTKDLIKKFIEKKL